MCVCGECGSIVSLLCDCGECYIEMLFDCVWLCVYGIDIVLWEVCFCVVLCDGCGFDDDSVVI